MGYALGVLTLSCIQGIAALGLAIFTGFTGQFSLGHAAFMGIGAYTAALLTYFAGVPFVIAVVAGALAATVISLVIGVPTLKAKLRSDYFAIAIMGFGEAVRVILENLQITQGARGLPGITRYTNLPVALLALAIMAWLARNFILSKYGWRAIAVREDPVAAEMMGIDLFRTKLLSLGASAFFSGVAGGLLAHYLMFIQPVMFTNVQSTQLIAAVVAGGIGSLTGPVLAAAIFIIIPELLRVANMWRLVIYGLMLILIMVFRPAGLMGYHELSLEWLRGLGRRNRRLTTNA
ncbi:MAG TPA: branched-chain amino acid ABC transporter permease [Firmicutes bacterium]|nr:branched-chain amino acid ABC transporter permease [Bacillota bacterium]